MKLIKITVKNADIFKELAKTTAYSAVKNKPDSDTGLFDRVATIGDDSILLTRYRDIACSEIVERLKNFVTAADFSGASLSLTLEVSGSFDESLSPSVKTDIFTFLVASVASRWFRITWPERADSYQTEAEQAVGELIRKLYHRVRPTRNKLLPPLTL